MVVGSRQKFNENFSYDSDAWLFDIQRFNGIKIMNDLVAEFFEFPAGRITFRYEFLHDLCPFPVNLVCRAGNGLVWTHPVNAFHENISKYSSIQSTQNQCRR